MKQIRSLYLTFCMLVVTGSMVVAQEGEPEIVTISDPVGMGDYVTALITALGVVLSAVVAGYFALLLVKKGLQWAKRIG